MIMVNFQQSGLIFKGLVLNFSFDWMLDKKVVAHEVHGACDWIHALSQFRNLMFSPALSLVWFFD